MSRWFLPKPYIDNAIFKYEDHSFTEMKFLPINQ